MYVRAPSSRPPALTDAVASKPMLPARALAPAISSPATEAFLISVNTVRPSANSCLIIVDSSPILTTAIVTAMPPVLIVRETMQSLSTAVSSAVQSPPAMRQMRISMLRVIVTAMPLANSAPMISATIRSRPMYSAAVWPASPASRFARGSATAASDAAGPRPAMASRTPVTSAPAAAAVSAAPAAPQPHDSAKAAPAKPAATPVPGTIEPVRDEQRAQQHAEDHRRREQPAVARDGAPRRAADQRR